MVSYLAGVMDIHNFISDDTFFSRNNESKSDDYDFFTCMIVNRIGIITFLIA